MEQKIVLITGASGKLGQNILKKLYTESRYKLISISSSIEKINELKKEYPEVDFVLCNLEHEGEIKDICTEIINRYKKVDVIINNAAVDIDKPFLISEISDFKRLWKINLFAPYLLIKYLLPSMITNKNGTILNISSNLSKRTVPNATEYSLSKAALDSLTRSLAVEFSRFNINSISINISGMRGKLLDVNENSKVLVSARDCDYSDWKIEKNRIPLRRCGKFEEYAEIIKFLISENAKYINGDCISVDGGVNSMQ